MPEGEHRLKGGWCAILSEPHGDPRDGFYGVTSGRFASVTAPSHLWRAAPRAAGAASALPVPGRPGSPSPPPPRMSRPRPGRGAPSAPPRTTPCSPARAHGPGAPRAPTRPGRPPASAPPRLATAPPPTGNAAGRYPAPRDSTPAATIHGSIASLPHPPNQTFRLARQRLGPPRRRLRLHAGQGGRSAHSGFQLRLEPGRRERQLACLGQSSP